MADEKTTLKINKAVDYLEKINSKQDVQQTRSLNQKMVDSLTSIEKSTEETNQLLKGVELSNARKQKDNVSIFKTMLSKFFPKEKDMNRTDDSEEKNYRERLLKNLTGLGDKLKGLKDKSMFGMLFGLLGSLLKGLFNGFKRLIFPMISSLFRYAVMPILKTIAKPFASLGKKAAGFLTKKGRRLNRRTSVTAGKLFRSIGKKGSGALETIGTKSAGLLKKALPFADDALKGLEKSSGKFLKLIGGTAKGFAKVAGPIGLAVTALDAGVTAVSKIANAGALLGKAEDAVTVGDRVRAASAGMVESVTFGLVSAEKFIKIQDKISDTIISGSEAIFGKNITNFGRDVLNFFDVIVTDFTTWLTGGNFWSEWRTGWDYLKNNFTDAIADMFSGFWDGIKNGLSSGVNWAYNALGGPNNPIIKWFKSLVSEVTEGWNNLYNLYIANNPVFKFFKNLGTSIADSITGLYDSLINKIKNSSVGKYLVGAWDRAKAITESTGPNKNETKNTAQTAQAAMRPAQVVRNDITYKNVKEAEKARSSEIHTNVSNAFKMNKNTAYNNLSGDDKRLAILMNFLLEQFAPYMSQLNAEAEKEGGNIQNVALVNPMR